MDAFAEDIKDRAGNISSSIAKGLLAGLAGTLAITISQKIEMAITGRKPSQAPAKGAEKAFGIEPDTKKEKEDLSQVVHWGYGTTWGLARSVMEETGITGPAATAIHFGAILGTALIMPPAMKLSPPPTEWSAKEIAVDALHHLVYAVAAGIVYDALETKSPVREAVEELSGI